MVELFDSLRSRVAATSDRIATAVSFILISKSAFYLVVACLLAYVGWSLTVVRTWSTVDYWEHLAAIGAFSRNLVSPDNPYTGPGNYIHLFTPYHLFWGVICRLTNTPPVLMSPVIGVVNIGLIVAASATMATHVLRDRRLSLVVVVTFLFLWFQPWKWSGFYCFGFLPTTSVYPFWCAIPIAVIVLSLFMEPSYRSVPKIVTLTLISAVVFLIHPITGFFLYPVLVIKSLLFTDCPARRRAYAIALLALSGPLVFLWPYFPVLGAIRVGPFEFNYYFFYQALPMRLAPMCLALVALVYSAARKEYDFVLVSLIFIGAVYVANFVWMQKAPLARFITYIILCLHIFTVRTFQLSLNRSISPTWILLFSVMLLGFAPMQIRESYSLLAIGSGETLRQGGAEAATLDSSSNWQINETFRKMLPWVGSSDVVLADAVESWILPATIGSQVVSVAHANPFMTDHAERKEAGRAFFAGEMSLSDADRMIACYRISHLLLKQSQLGLVKNIPRSVTEVWNGREYVLYRIED
jgi:hypothetical protein